MDHTDKDSGLLPSVSASKKQRRQTSWPRRACQTTCERRLTFYQWLWVHLIGLSFKAPPWQTERVITTESSCPSLHARLSEVTSLSVWASEPVLHILPPGRCTSLLWLNRLSRDPINHHLHSLALSPFTTDTSSHTYTQLPTYALHGTPMQIHVQSGRSHHSPSSLPLPLLPQHPISQHTHTHTQTCLGSIPQPPHQARLDSYYSERCPILLPSLPLSAGCLGLQQPIDLRWRLSAPLTWMYSASIYWNACYLSTRHTPSNNCSFYSCQPR